MNFKRVMSLALTICMMASCIAQPVWAEEVQGPLPTEVLTETVTAAPTEIPTTAPTEVPAENPAEEPAEVLTEAPIQESSETAIDVSTEEPPAIPTEIPTEIPVEVSTDAPTEEVTEEPTAAPTEEVTEEPTAEPTEEVTEDPTAAPTEEATEEPTAEPTEEVTEEPTAEPTESPVPTEIPFAAGFMELRAGTWVYAGRSYNNEHIVLDDDAVVWATDEIDRGEYGKGAVILYAFEGKILEGCVRKLGKLYSAEESAAYRATVNRSAAVKVASLADVYLLPVVPRIEATETPMPTAEPTAESTEETTAEPTVEPTEEATAEPTTEPTTEPTEEATAEPTTEPTEEATEEPTTKPTEKATEEPTTKPTKEATAEPTTEPTAEPSEEEPEISYDDFPSQDAVGDVPTEEPTPDSEATEQPTEPTAAPTEEAKEEPATESTEEATAEPTAEPTATPVANGSIADEPEISYEDFLPFGQRQDDDPASDVPAEEPTPDPEATEISAEPEAQPAISLEMAGEALVCCDVPFTVTAVGADSFVLEVYAESGEHLLREEMPLTDGAATFTRRVEAPCTERIVASFLAGEQVIAAETTTAYAALGELSAPEMLSPAEFASCTPFTVEWTPVEGAQGYHIVWTKPDGSAFPFDTAEPTLALAEADTDQIGEYRLTLCAVCAGYTAAPLDAVLQGTAGIMLLSAEADFEVSEDGTLTKYVGPGGDVEIPDTVNGITITGIGYQAFYDCDSITSVYIPDSVTWMYADLFWSCDNLRQVNIPMSWTSVSGTVSPFANCPQLTHITIPEGKTGIPAYAFDGMNSLTSVTIPESVTEIGAFAFSDTGLTSFNVPSGVATIQSGVFSGCRALKNVELPEGLLKIESQAFYYCKSLTNISIPKSVTEIGPKAFKDDTELTSIKIPGSVTVIGYGAFENCTSLQNVELSEGLLSIGTGTTSSDCTGVFGNCNSLTSIHIPNSVTHIDGRAFDGCSNLSQVNIPMNWTEVKAFYVSPFTNCPMLTSITVPEGKTSIPEDAFHGMNSLTNISIPESIVEIGQNAFRDSGLTSVVIPSGVTKIQNCTFYECTALQNVELSEELLSIDTWSFYNCNSLTNISIPKFVTEIGNSAFRCTANLTSVSLFDTLTYVDFGAFSIEESPNLFFTIYVSDIDAVSYIEQYAINHNIPYTKLLYEPENTVTLTASKAEAWTCEDVTFTVTSNIPSGTVQLYAEDTLLAEKELVNSTASLEYAFRMAGDRQIRAEINGVSSDILPLKINCLTSLDKPVVTAEPEQTYNEPMRIGWAAIDHADGYVVRVIDQNGDSFYHAEVTTNGSQEYRFEIPSAELRGPGSYAVFVMAYGMGYDQSESAAVTVQIKEQEESYPFYFIMDRNEITAGESVQFTVIVTEGYSRPDGLSLLINGEYSGGYSLGYEPEIINYTFDQPGVYQISFQGRYKVPMYPDDYVICPEQTLIVKEKENKLSFTMDRSTITAGETVMFTVTAPGAMQVQLIVDSEYYDTYEVVDGTAIGTRTFTQAGIRQVAFRALYDGEWSGLCTPQTLTVISKGKLDAPVVSVGPWYVLGQDVLINWTAVEHTTAYNVYVYDATGNVLFKQESVTETALTVPASAFPGVGSYTLTVMAFGTGYDQSEGSGVTEIISQLSGPVILTPEADTVLPDQSVLLTWEAVTGATGYVVTLARKTGAVDEYGQLVYEKVWSPDTVNVGNVTSYALDGLVYGTEYRAAVGTLNPWNDQIGWSTCTFAVQSPKPGQLTVTAQPNPAWVDTDVTFTVTGDANTNTVDVYQEDTFLATVPFAAELSDRTKHIFQYIGRFSEAGEYTLHFTPVNAQGEWSEPTYFTLTAMPKGQATNPVIENLHTGDFVADENYVVRWQPAVAGAGTELSGYCVILSKLVDGTWQLVPGQVYQGTGLKTEYTLSGLEAGNHYQLEVYTLMDGHTEPDLGLSGHAVTDFYYRIVPTPQVTVTSNQELLAPVTISWEQAPMLTNVMPDEYVLWIFKPDGSSASLSVGHGSDHAFEIPGEYFDQIGNYQLSLYATMYQSWPGVEGAHSIVDVFCQVVQPEIIVDSPAQNTKVIPNETIWVSGSAKGGIRQIQLDLTNEAGQNVPFVIDLDEGAQTVTSWRMLISTENQFLARIMIPENTPAGTYYLRVSGFAKENGSDPAVMPISIALQMKDASIEDIQWFSGNRYQSIRNQYRYNYVGEKRLRAIGNALLDEVQLLRDRKIQKTISNPTELSAGVHALDTTIQLIEGIHTYAFRSTADPDSVMETTICGITPIMGADGKTPGIVRYIGNESIGLRGWPTAGSAIVATFIQDDEILLCGKTGDYYYIKKDGKAYFVSENEVILKESISPEILSPGNGEVVNVWENNAGLTVEWEPCEQATYYRVQIIVTATVDGNTREIKLFDGKVFSSEISDGKMSVHIATEEMDALLTQAEQKTANPIAVYVTAYHE